jgi:hypothetical protein
VALRRASSWSGRREAGGEGLLACEGVRGQFDRLFDLVLLLLLEEEVEGLRLRRGWRLLPLRDRFVALLPLVFLTFLAED